MIEPLNSYSVDYQCQMVEVCDPLLRLYLSIPIHHSPATKLLHDIRQSASDILSPSCSESKGDQLCCAFIIMNRIIRFYSGIIVPMKLVRASVVQLLCSVLV